MDGHGDLFDGSLARRDEELISVPPPEEACIYVAEQACASTQTAMEADWVSLTILPSKRWTVRSA